MMTEGEIEQALGARRMTSQIEHLAKHVIICGFGRIGRTLADEMSHKGEPFVVIDADPEQIADGKMMGFLMLSGNATDEEILLAAGVRRAKTLVSALNRDSDNVFITLTSRNLNASLHIIARGEQPATEKKLFQAGADHVVLPAVIGARRMATMVTRPHAADLIDQVTDHKILDADLEEVVVSDSSPGVGKTVQEIMAHRKHRLLVVAVRQPDGEMVFAPEADYRLAAGATMIVMGRPADTARFRTMYES